MYMYMYMYMYYRCNNHRLLIKLKLILEKLSILYITRTENGHYWHTCTLFYIHIHEAMYMCTCIHYTIHVHVYVHK